MKFTNMKNPWLSKPRVPEPGMRLAPPDGGWGWIFVTAGCLNMWCFVNLCTTYAVLFSRHLQELGASKTTYAVITNLNFSIWSVMALVMGPVCDIYGHKRVTIAGGVLSFVTLVTCAFAPSVVLFTIAYGFIGGLSGAFVTFPAAVLIPQYFDKRKGIANGTMSCVLSLGKAAMPLIVQFLLDYYGYKSTCLLLGAWCLNTIVLGLTQHPPHWHQIQVPIDTKPEDINNLPLKVELGDSGIVETNTKVEGLDPSARQYKEELRDEEELVFQRTLESSYVESKESVSYLRNADKKLLVNKIKEEDEEYKLKSALGSTFSLATSVNDLMNVPIESNDKEKELKSNSTWDKFIVFRVFRMMEYSLLLDPFLYMVSLPSTFSLLIYINFLYLVNDHLEDIGVSPYRRALLFSIMAGSEFVNRLLFAWLSDFKWLSKRWVYIIGSFMNSASMLCIPAYSSFWWVVVFSTIYASGRAVLSVIQIHLSLQYIDKALYPQVVGFGSIMNFFAYTIGGVAIGSLRTALDSSAITMQVLGCLASLSGIIWLMEPLIKKMKKRRDQNKEKHIVR